MRWQSDPRRTEMGRVGLVACLGNVVDDSSLCPRLRDLVTKAGASVDVVIGLVVTAI